MKYFNFMVYLFLAHVLASQFDNEYTYYQVFYFTILLIAATALIITTKGEMKNENH